MFVILFLFKIRYLIYYKNLISMISMIYLKTTGIITLLNKIFFDQGDCCHSMENRKATTHVAATV